MGNFFRREQAGEKEGEERASGREGGRGEESKRERRRARSRASKRERRMRTRVCTRRQPKTHSAASKQELEELSREVARQDDILEQLKRKAASVKNQMAAARSKRRKLTDLIYQLI